MRVAMLLSGGVDSSVALRLLLEEPQLDVQAFYLKIWLEDELAFLGDCPWEEDLRYARAVCEQAGVPLHVVPMQREYQQRIVAYTLDELRAGRTPSSDVLCNRRIKFGTFLEHVDALATSESEGAFESVASGHYAQLWLDPAGSVHLLRSPDPIKDQTYFLSRLTQAQLQRCRFPLGPYTKAEVRRLAANYDLPNQERPDSQGICFLGQIPFDDFVRHHLGERPGEIRELETGRVLGEHRGYWFATIGQRRGLGLSGGPWYVVRKDVDANVLWVSHREHLQDVERSEFEIDDLHWLGSSPPKLEEQLHVKLRHGPQLLPCSLRASDAPGRLRVLLETSDPGIAEGQFAVFYADEECLGAGVVAA